MGPALYSAWAMHLLANISWGSIFVPHTSKSETASMRSLALKTGLQDLGLEYSSSSTMLESWAKSAERPPWTLLYLDYTGCFINKDGQPGQEWRGVSDVERVLRNQRNNITFVIGVTVYANNKRGCGDYSDARLR